MTPYQTDFSRMCPDCLGTGKKKTPPVKVPCDSCNGRGFTEFSSQDRVENIIPPCPVCHGTGKVEMRTDVSSVKSSCSICGGTGWIQTANPPGSLNNSNYSARRCPACNNQDATNRFIGLDMSVDSRRSMKCLLCNGTGLDISSKSTRSPQKIQSLCIKCNGSGMKTMEGNSDLICLRCNGTGFLS